MKSAMTRTLCAALLPLGLVVSACSSEPETPMAAASTENGTLAEAIAGSEELSTLSTALGDAQLSDVFDGTGAYTVLAPTNAAFEALGAGGQSLMTEEQRPVLVGVLREHVLPGHLTAEAIGTAIENGGGSATMTTLGGGTVTFTGKAGRMTVSHSSGASAELLDGGLNAGNGSALPINAVLAGASPDGQ